MSTGLREPRNATARVEEGAHVSRHLVSVSSAVRLRISEGLRELGHDLSVANTHLIPNLPIEGLGMSALAERAAVSLQRAGQLVQQLEDDGYVKRVADERDRRARRVVYTRRGKKLLRDTDELLDQITGEFRELLGDRAFAQLLKHLAVLDDALGTPGGGLRVAGRE